MTTIPNLPIPAGALAGDWYGAGGCDHPDDISRTLTWSLHDVDEVRVSVAGVQCVDCRDERFVLLAPGSADVELDAGDVRQLAGALLDAADSLDTL